MAYYAALCSATQLLDDILHPHRYPDFFPLKPTTITSLHQHFTRLLDSLEDDIDPSASDHVHARITDVSYQVLDTLDDLTALIHQLTRESRVVGYRRHVAFNKHLRVRLSMTAAESKLEKVGLEVDSIVQELNTIAIWRSRLMMAGDQHVSLHHDVAAAASEHEQPLIGVGDTNPVVGLEEHLAAIKDQLFGWSPRLQVISIVGMGGIGKTTLARNIFQDALILQDFDFRVWVLVSQDYRVVRVLENIITSLGIMTTQQCEALRKEMDVSERERALKTQVYRHLIGRKYLILIDDVWDTRVWDDLKQMFPQESMRSRIVLTTRLVEVAVYSGSTHYLHHMRLLSTDESWSLLQEKSFAKEDCPLELVDVGKRIANKCRGLPLAVVIIGGILSNNRTIQYWKSVATNVGLVLNEQNEQLSKILSLSYNHLPHRLKPCFLHMGSFPEAYEINVSKLIKLWISEGFLKPDSSSNPKSIENVGKECLEDLVKRSLVVITKKRADGSNKSCIMHDLLRDFCRQRGLQEQFFHTADPKGCLKRNGVEKVRRIFLNSVPQLAPWTNNSGKHVRSICLFGKETRHLNPNTMKWDHVNRLRILDVADSRYTLFKYALPSKLNLRYIAFNASHRLRFIDCESILVELQNLETLIISIPLNYTLTLPPEIWKMRSLRYLILNGGMNLSRLPDDSHLNRLEHLHTLQTVENFKFTPEVIHMIPNVRKLKIRFFLEEEEKDGNIWNSFCLNNLVSLLQLEELTITFDGHVPENNSLCRSFVFPQNLTKLSLSGCELPWDALTVNGVGSLKCLQVLKLGYRAMVGPTWEPVDGEFLELKFLLLEELKIVHWEAESIHFPKLQHLKINGCRHLEEIPSDIGDIGTLEFITLHSSPFARDSARKILEEQHDFGNYGLRVIVRDDPFWDAWTS